MTTAARNIRIPLRKPRAFLLALIYIFVATFLFSITFVWAYGFGVLAKWGIVIGAGAAASWVFFILLIARLGRLAVTDATRICARTMVPGNTVLLASAALNTVSYLYAVYLPFIVHVFIIGLANLVMFYTFSHLTRKRFSLGMRAGLWFGALNGIFTIILLAAWRLWIA